MFVTVQLDSSYHPLIQSKAAYLYIRFILVVSVRISSSLPWRHNGRDGVSNHQPHHCLLNGLFRRRSNKTSKLRVTGLCAGNSPVTGEFPVQMASNAETVSIWWRHHGPGINYVQTRIKYMYSTAVCLVTHSTFYGLIGFNSLAPGRWGNNKSTYYSNASIRKLNASEHK